MARNETTRTKTVTIAKAHPNPGYLPVLRITRDDIETISSWSDMGSALRGQKITVHMTGYNLCTTPMQRVNVGKENATILAIDDAGMMTIEYDAPGNARERLSTDAPLALDDTGMVIVFKREGFFFGGYDYDIWTILCIRTRED